VPKRCRRTKSSSRCMSILSTGLPSSSGGRTPPAEECPARVVGQATAIRSPELAAVTSAELDVVRSAELAPVR
jgi:hypothetical protein